MLMRIMMEAAARCALLLLLPHTFVAADVDYITRTRVCRVMFTLYVDICCHCHVMLLLMFERLQYLRALLSASLMDTDMSDKMICGDAYERPLSFSPRRYAITLI